MPQPRIQFLLCLLVYTVIVRVLPYVLMNCDVAMDPTVLYYPWNFSPLTAVCLFGGAFLTDRKMPFLIPLATLFASDLGIAVLSGHMDWAFPPGRWGFTYFSFAAAAALGFVLRGGKTRGLAGRAVALGLTFEVAFFALSNLLVWYYTVNSSAAMYPNTAAGLAQCYYVALPFFGKSLLGTTAFTMLLFSPVGVRASTEKPSEVNSGELVRVRAG